MNEDRVYEAYFGIDVPSETHELTRRRVDWIVDHVPSGYIADVGSSQGLVSLLLATRGDRVVGVEIESGALEFACKQRSGVPADVAERLTFVRDDAEAMSFVDGSFEHAVCGELLEHVDDPARVVEEVFRILKPGATLVVTTPYGTLPHPDHKRVFYRASFQRLLDPCFELRELTVLEKHLAAVAIRRDEPVGRPRYRLDHDEVGFKRREDHHLERIDDLAERLRDANLSYRNASERLGEGRAEVTAVQRERESLAARLEAAERELRAGAALEARQRDQLDAAASERRALRLERQRMLEHLEHVVEAKDLLLHERDDLAAAQEQLADELERLRTKEHRMESEHLELVQTIQRARRRHDDVVEARDVLIVERDQLDSKVASLVAERAKLQSDIKRLAAVLRATRSSRSWRYTARARRTLAVPRRHVRRIKRIASRRDASRHVFVRLRRRHSRTSVPTDATGRTPISTPVPVVAPATPPTAAAPAVVPAAKRQAVPAAPSAAPLQHTPTADELMTEFDAWIERARAAPGDEVILMYSGTTFVQEMRGNRPIRLTKVYLGEDCPVFFNYWRWRNSEQHPGQVHPLLFQSPVDLTPALLPRLLEADFGSKKKVFFASFPHELMMRTVVQAKQHGWKTVYDARDDWEEFAKAGAARWYRNSFEAYIAGHVDVVTAVSAPLARKMSVLGRREDVHVVPNGLDTDFPAPPAPRAPVEPPVIGYFGHLTEKWFDWDLLETAARQHPDWRFELAGHQAPEARKLPRNIALLGLQTHSELAKLSTRWSLAIIPFKVSALADSVDPIKVYEYLHLGLPVLSSYMPQMRHYPGVTIAESGREFLRLLPVSVDIELDTDAVGEWLANNRWEDRVARYRELCAAAPKAPRSSLWALLESPA